MTRMAAITSCMLAWIKGSNYSTFQHAFNLPFPTVMHKVLEESDVAKYDEVFVVGDVHGCYDELIKLLQDAQVTSDTSLKIFVGDLVNKGPKNHEVVEFLRNSNSMLSVRGNHDEVVLREYFDNHRPGYVLAENNKWIKDLPREDIDYLINLPYTISMPSLQAIVVHAGLVPGLSLSSNDPAKMVTMRNLVLEDYFWGRGIWPSKKETEGQPWASLWPGPTHIYFGHDAKRMLQCYEHATGLDTGCVYGNWLTGLFISGPRKGTFVTVNAMKVHKNPTMNVKT